MTGSRADVASRLGVKVWNIIKYRGPARHYVLAVPLALIAMGVPALYVAAIT